jgi:hypothetical protein
LGSRSFLGFWSTPGNGLDGLMRQFFDSRVLSRPSKREILNNFFRLDISVFF